MVRETRRRAPVRRLTATLAWGLWAAVALASCAARGPTVTVTRGGDLAVGKLRLLVVYPVGFDHEVSPAETYRKTLDLLAGLGEGRGPALIAPWEYDLRNPRTNELSTASKALLRARQLGYAPETVGLLRVRVLRQVQRGSATIVSSTGQRRGQRAAEDLRYTIVGELWRYFPMQELRELRCTVRHDPFAEHPDWDPVPALRAGVRAVGREVRGILPGDPQASAALALTTADSARPLLDLRGAAGGTLAEEVAAAGLLMGELKLWRIFQYLEPGISSAQARRLAELPPGVGVRAPLAAVSSGPLRVGDLITGVDGAPVRHTHELQRAWRGRRGRPLKVEVRRAGKRHELLLPPG